MGTIHGDFEVYMVKKEKPLASASLILLLSLRLLLEPISREKRPEHTFWI